jgi:hypothetical protein
VSLGRSRKGNQIGLKLNGTFQLLAYADVNRLGDTIQKDTEIVIDASEEVGLQIKAEKTKYMLLSCHQKNHYRGISNRLSENVAQFRYLGMTVYSTKSKFGPGGN